jgi:hypothetical protein
VAGEPVARLAGWWVLRGLCEVSLDSIVMRRHPVKEIPVAKDAWPAGATERTLVRTTSARAAHAVHNESNQEHGQDDKNAKRGHRFFSPTKGDRCGQLAFH